MQSVFIPIISSTFAGGMRVSGRTVLGRMAITESAVRAVGGGGGGGGTALVQPGGRRSGGRSSAGFPPYPGDPI